MENERKGGKIKEEKGLKGRNRRERERKEGGAALAFPSWLLHSSYLQLPSYNTASYLLIPLQPLLSGSSMCSQRYLGE